MQNVLQEAHWARRIHWKVQIKYRIVSQSDVNLFLGFHTIGVIDGSDVQNEIIDVVADPLFSPRVNHAKKNFLHFLLEGLLGNMNNSDYLQILLQYLQRVFFLSIYTVFRNVLFIYKYYRLFPSPDTHLNDPW